MRRSKSRARGESLNIGGQALGLGDEGLQDPTALPSDHHRGAPLLDQGKRFQALKGNPVQLGMLKVEPLIATAPSCLRDFLSRPALKHRAMLMRIPSRWARPKRLRPPGFIVPCQPILAAPVPDGDGWMHELKHDGFRIVAQKDGDKVRLWSRNGRDWSAEFVAITAASWPCRSPGSCWTARRSRTAQGLPDFNALLRRSGCATAWCG